MANGFSENDIDRMKADAIRRARQMHLRAAVPPQAAEAPPKEEFKEAKSNENPGKKSGGLNNLFAMTKMFGMENDQIILIAIILLLKGEKKTYRLF